MSKSEQKRERERKYSVQQVWGMCREGRKIREEREQREEREERERNIRKCKDNNKSKEK